MRVFTFSEAGQRLAEVLDIARREEVLITRRGGVTFAVTYKRLSASHFDVPGVKTKATTRDVLKAVKESPDRERRELRPQATIEYC